MKVDLSALWQTLTKRTAALLADEQKRTGLLVAVGLLGLVLLGVSSWLPAKSKPETTAPMPQSTITSDYEAYLEARLQTLISNLAGAGETRVMVTLQCGEESIYAADTETSAPISLQGIRPFPGTIRLHSPVCRCPRRFPAWRIASPILTSSIFMWNVSSITFTLSLSTSFTNSTPSSDVFKMCVSNLLITSIPRSIPYGFAASASSRTPSTLYFQSSGLFTVEKSTGQ